MTPKRWLVLLCFYISYLFLGASIYYYIENNLEIHRRAKALEKRIEINGNEFVFRLYSLYFCLISEYLRYHFKGKDSLVQEDILTKITNYCGKSVTNYTLDEFEEPFVWNFYHSLFFAFTVCSTVGYGNLAPTTTLGRMIMIVYSLIGIPINGILFAGLGEFFTNFFTNIYRKYKNYKMANDDLYVPYKIGLFATVIIALVPGVTFFIFVPSLLFSYFEGWPLTLSIYYSYVTTTTIGFGDYVPTFQSHQLRDFGVYFILYQIFIIIWFIFSLGYLVMIMTFITRALRSQKLFVLERQLKDQIKITQHKIWHGVTKDVTYLRHILNELYINAKPLYEESNSLQNLVLPKSCSCPDLELYRESKYECLSRKRTFSESFDQLLDGNRKQLANGTPLHGSLLRVFSESGLHQTNNEKTEETINAFKETTNLLAKVVSALSNIKPSLSDGDNSTNFYEGYNGFSDSQILFNEQSQNLNKFHRCRAQSDFHLNPKSMLTNLGNEWTWCGDNNQIQQVINDRVRLKENNQRLGEKIVPANLDESEFKKKTRKFSTDSFALIKKLFPFKKRDSQDLLEQKDEKNNSTISVSVNKDRSLFEKNYLSVNNNDLIRDYENDAVSRNARRNTMIKSNQIENRRHSLFVRSELRNSTAFKSDTPNEAISKHRKIRSGSLFQQPNKVFNDPRHSLCNLAKTSSRASISAVNEEDLNVLEQTSIADIIRAIETLHTKSFTSPSSYNETAKSRKNRKKGTVTPPNLPPILTLFNDCIQNEQNIENRSCNRRQTINNIGISNLLNSNMERKTSAIEISDDSDKHMRTKSESLSEDLQFRQKLRRFSIRPVKKENFLKPTEFGAEPSISLKSNPIAKQSINVKTPLSRIAQMQSMRKHSAINLNIPPSDNKDK